MVGFVDIDAELRQARDTLEAGIDREFGIAFWRVLAQHFIEFAINLSERTGSLGEEFVGRRWRCAPPLQNDLLCVRDDDVEGRAILRADGRSGVIQEVEFQIGAEEVCVFRRDDKAEVEGLDFLEGLENRLVRREDERVLAEARVLAEFVGEQEFIEDARRHQDRFAESHGQCENIVRVGPRPLAQTGEDFLILFIALKI